MAATTEPRRWLTGVDVKAYREKHDISQAQLAERTGFTESYVCKIEQGQRAISEDFEAALRLLDADELTLRLIGERLEAQLENCHKQLREQTEMLQRLTADAARWRRVTERRLAAPPPAIPETSGRHKRIYA